MARTALAVQDIDADGLNPSFTAANVDGHSVDDDADYVEVVNASAGSINVTVQTPATVAGLDVAERVVAVPAGERRKVSLLDRAAVVRPTGGTDPGTVYVDFSAVASVTCGAFRSVRS